MMTQTKPTNGNQNPNANTPRPAPAPSAPVTSANVVADSAPAQTAQPSSGVVNPSAPAPALTMTEAPYSWNVSAQDPETGFIEQFTVRAISFEGFTQRVAMVKRQLAERKYKPAPRYGAHSNASTSAAQEDPAPVCAIHKTQMQKRQGKNGGSFYSCQTKLENGEWCPYKVNK